MFYSSANTLASSASFFADSSCIAFVNIGINLIVADYQGYGLSNGKPTKSNLHNDANKIFKYVNDYLFNNKYIVYKLIYKYNNATSIDV